MRPFGVARYAEHRTRLVDGDGRVFAGHLDESAGGVPRAVVVIHDFYGLTQPVRTAATRLAADGFVVFAPDLYRGRVATSPADAGALASQLAWDQVALELGLVVAALRRRSAGMKVATLGFAMGGAASLVAAAALPDLAAAVTYYGVPQDVVLRNRRVRVLGHFGARDVKVTPPRVDALAAMFATHGIDGRLHRYDAAGNFANPLLPEVFDAAAADTAWQRTLAFLHETLG